MILWVYARFNPLKCIIPCYVTISTSNVGWGMQLKITLIYKLDKKKGSDDMDSMLSIMGTFTRARLSFQLVYMCCH